MAKSVLYMSMSLDGFITGPDDGTGNGLGNGGHREQTHPEDVDVARRLRGRRQRRQHIHLLLHVRGRCHRAEAAFIGGNGFRAARAVHHLECRTGRLVLEANQFLLWSILEKAGAPVAVRGVGMLFDDRQPDENKTEER